MNAAEKSKYWLDLSDYDLETAEAMFKTKRWLYVGFMCHQTIEKVLKGYWCAKQPDNDPPYQHNLIRLVEGAGLLHALSEEQMDIIDELMPLNIEARYPSYKEQLEKAMTPDKCREIINNTKDLQQWIKNKL